MALWAIRLRKIAELIVGVVPTTIVFTPFLLLLTQALAMELVPGLVRGRAMSEDWAGLFTLLLGPLGFLALVSLTLLIVRGPEYVVGRRRLTLLVVGSGIPALLFSLYFLWLQIVDPRARATGGELLLLLPLAASTLVGLRYLEFLPLLVPRPPRPKRRRSTARSSRSRPSGARRGSRSGRSRARPSRSKRA